MFDHSDRAQKPTSRMPKAIQANVISVARANEMLANLISESVGPSCGKESISSVVNMGSSCGPRRAGSVSTATERM